MTSEYLLPEFIRTFVPLEIMRMEKQGGPTTMEYVEAIEYFMGLLDRGEGTELLFRIKGKTARSASMLVRLIACMAFEAGGIKVFGHHFVAYEHTPSS